MNTTISNQCEMPKFRFLHIDPDLRDKLRRDLDKPDFDINAFPNTLRILEKTDKVLGEVKPKGLHATITGLNVGSYWTRDTHTEPVVDLFVGSDPIMSANPNIGFSEEQTTSLAKKIVENIISKTITPISDQINAARTGRQKLVSLFRRVR